jgi:hypothetical protein
MVIEKGCHEARRARHNSRMKSCLTTAVRRTLHAKPLGDSKKRSAHPCQLGGGQESDNWKRGLAEEKKTKHFVLPSS